jgi:hypothetical protein
MKYENIYDLKYSHENINGLRRNILKELIISMKNIDEKQ